MRRIGRYTFGVGFGAFLLATVGGSAWPQASQLAGAAVAIGWLFWGVLALQGELGAVAGGAARFAFDAAGAMFSRSESDAENDGLNIAEIETLPAAPATRFIRINDANGSRWLAVDCPRRTPYRNQVRSFLILGERVGSFTWRDLRGRSLGGEVRIDRKLWGRITGDLVRAGLFWKDRQRGTRPRSGLRDAAMSRLAHRWREAGGRTA